MATLVGFLPPWTQKRAVSDIVLFSSAPNLSDPKDSWTPSPTLSALPHLMLQCHLHEWREKPSVQKDSGKSLCLLLAFNFNNNSQKSAYNF